MMSSRISSIASVKALLLFLALWSSAHGAQDQKPLDDNQKPPIDNENIASETFGPLPNEPTEALKWPSRDAEMKLYLNPKYPCVPERNGLVSEFSLPVDTCASANFTLDNNALIEYPGVCTGGSRAPYLAIYRTADCTGVVAHPTWYDWSFSSVGRCLSTAVWGQSAVENKDFPSGQWSIMFRCADREIVPDRKDIRNISLPVPPPKVEKPQKPRPSFGSVSDSACYIPSLGMKGHPRFIFQKPEPDTCVDVAALHKLKIYRNALCPNGTEALFAKWNTKGCHKDSISVQKVDESLIATNDPKSCIDMGGDAGSSYAFLCTGDLTRGKVAQSLFDDDDPDAIHVHYSFGNSRARKASKSLAPLSRIEGTWVAMIVLCTWFGLQFLL